MAKARPNYPAVAVWAWRGKGDMLVVKRTHEIKAYQYSSRA